MTDSVDGTSTSLFPGHLSELPQWILDLMESLSSLVAYVDLAPEPRVRYVNPAGRSMLGMQDSAIPGLHRGTAALVTEWLPPDAIRTVTLGEVWEDTTEVLNPSTGEKVPLDRRIYPIAPSADGSVVAACVIANDTSRQAQHKRTSQVLRGVIDHVPAAVTVFAPDDSLNVIYANPASLAQNGVDDANLLSIKLRSGFPDSKAIEDFTSNIVPRVLADEQVEQTTEIRNAKTSEELPVQRTIFPVYGENNGSVIAIGIISTNIERLTHRVDRAETKLAQQDVLIGAVQEMYGDEKRRADYLEQIQVIASHTASRTDTSEMLDYAARAIREAFGYYVVAIHILEPETNRLVIKAIDGAGTNDDSGPMTERLSIDSTRNAAGWVATSGEELLIDDAESDQYEPLEGWTDTQSHLLVPISYSNRVIGVLDIHGNRPKQFDEVDRIAARIIAGQIAVSMEVARLFDQSREQTLQQERSRLAREMHDSLIQKLASVHWQVSALKMNLQSSETLGEELDKIESVSTLVQDALDEARRSVWNLGANELEGSSLADALDNLVSRISSESELDGSFRLEGSDPVTGSTIERAVLRISQEAINNAVAHANASSFDVVLKMDEASLVLVITDDGDGFDMTTLPEPTRESGYGLVSMNERARLVSGELTVTSSPGSGTEIRLVVPLAPTEDAGV